MVKCSSFCCHLSTLCLHPAMIKFKFGCVMQPTNLILYGHNICHHDTQLDTAVSFVCMSPSLLVEDSASRKFSMNHVCIDCVDRLVECRSS